MANRRRTELRQLVYDTHASNILSELDNSDKPWPWPPTGIDLGEQRANNLQLNMADFKQLAKLFTGLQQRLCNTPGEVGFTFNRREYTFIPQECHIAIGHGGKGGSVDYVKAELRLTMGGRFVRITYSLYLHNNSGPTLAFIGNPTTIITGSNIRPIRVDGVSTYRETLIFYQLGFLMLPAIFHREKFTWTKQVAKRIQLGEINVSNTQWALYLPTDSKRRMLALLTSLYASMLPDKHQPMQLAEYLGWESATKMQDERGQLTGLFLVKKRGRNHVLTVNFYDKRESVHNRKQGGKLLASEAKLIDGAIRLDITGHAAFLLSMIKLAQKRASELAEIRPELRSKLRRFVLDNSDRITAYRLCRAMSILAIKVEHGELYKGSFTGWLMQRVVEQELKLLSILQHGEQYVHITGKDQLDQQILSVWRKLPRNQPDIIAGLQRAFPDHQQRWAYRQVDRVRQEYGLDMRLPYVYYLDSDALMQHYGLTVADRALAYDARRRESALTNEQRQQVRDKLSRKQRSVLLRDKQRLLGTFKLVAKAVKADNLDLQALAGE